MPNHLRQYLKGPHPYETGMTPREDFYALDLQEQNVARTAALLILSAWYDSLIKSYAIDFLSWANNSANYEEGKAQQHLRTMADRFLVYPHTCQQVILCSPCVNTQAGATGLLHSNWFDLAASAFTTDILERLDSRYHFNWETGKHKEITA